MFDQVTIRVSDREASERFYATVLHALEIEPTRSGERFAAWDDFSLAATTPGSPVTRGLHIGFAAPSRAHADAFWRAGTDAGHLSDGGPGPRPQYKEDYYGSFLLDPDGNSAEAVHHDSLRTGGIVDHLWIRVADLSASRRFYEEIAPRAGLRKAFDTDERVRFAGTSGSFTLLPGEPTEHVHLAFSAVGAEGTGANSRIVRDPDGNTVELIGPGRTPG